MFIIDRLPLYEYDAEASSAFVRGAVQALVAAGIIVGGMYSDNSSAERLFVSNVSNGASAMTEGAENNVLAAQIEKLAGDDLNIVVINHKNMPGEWSALPLEERSRLVGSYIMSRLAERGVSGFVPQYDSLVLGIAADGMLPSARSVEMIRVSADGSVSTSHLCVAVPESPATARAAVNSGSAWERASVPARDISDEQWRRFVGAHEIFHCLDFHQKGAVWRITNRSVSDGVASFLPSPEERFADAAAAAWVFGTGPESAPMVRTAADLRALEIVDQFIHRRVVSLSHWTVPVLDALADRLERGEGLGASGVAGIAALARTAMADSRSFDENLSEFLERANDPQKRSTEVGPHDVVHELIRLGAPRAIVERVELALARQGDQLRLPAPRSTESGILLVSALAADLSHNSNNPFEGVGIRPANMSPIPSRQDLAFDSRVGLFVPAKEEARERSGNQLDSSTDYIPNGVDGGSPPRKEEAWLATLRALDLMGRHGVLTGRFYSWSAPLDPLEQEEVRIRHEYQQEMLRCATLQAGAGALANIFASPSAGFSFPLSQLGAGLAVEACRLRAAQNAELARARLREMARQRELARREHYFRHGQRPEGYFVDQPSQQRWPYNQRQGPLKDVERVR